MRTICHSLYIISIFSPYYPLPGFPPALITYASFLMSLLPLSPPHSFLISFFLACSSNLIRSLWQHTFASNQVLAFLTNIRRAGITTSLGSAGFRSGFRPNGWYRWENTSPVCREVRQRPSGSRFAKSKCRSIGMDDTERNFFLLAICGSRTWKGWSAVERNASTRRIRIAIALPVISVNTRGGLVPTIGAGCVHEVGGDGGGSPSLACSLLETRGN